MSTAAVVTYKQMPADAPEAFLEAVTPSLFSLLKMQPINVLFKKAQDHADWAGYCGQFEYTEAGEITIDARWVEEHVYQPNKRNILRIYLHECAHRLLPNAGHNAVFFALNMLMHLRADSHSVDLWHKVSLYDIQDEQDIPKAFDWAYGIAYEHVHTEKTCEECAAIFSERYQRWLAWLDGAELRAASLKAKWQALDADVQHSKLQRWIFLMGGVAIGFVSAVWFSYYLFHKMYG